MSGAMRTGLGAWLRDAALPLWLDAGWDAHTGSFVEGLAFDGRPLAGLPRRTMVQARQIVVCCTAARRGWHPLARERAVEAAATLLARRGEEPGFPFARDAASAVLDGTRDLYAHAFVLLALAELARLTGEPSYLAEADATLAFLDTIRESEGYAEAAPRRDALRRQDPHMHLFEALLALHEADPERGYRDRAALLRDLMVRRFLVGPLPVLAETFDAAWRPAEGTDPPFEPGHHFEWAWLLHRHACLGGGPEDPLAGVLWRVAFARGVGPDLLIPDRVAASGRVVAASTRLWPYAEAAKAATCPFASAPGALPLRFLAALERRFPARGAQGRPGVWIDRLDAGGAPVSAVVPASSLYHLCGAVEAVEAWCAPG